MAVPMVEAITARRSWTRCWSGLSVGPTEVASVSSAAMGVPPQQARVGSAMHNVGNKRAFCVQTPGRMEGFRGIGAFRLDFGLPDRMSRNRALAEAAKH